MDNSPMFVEVSRSERTGEFSLSLVLAMRFENRVTRLTVETNGLTINTESRVVAYFIQYLFIVIKYTKN